MASNKKLNKAIRAKNDEFYTRKVDIEQEIQAYLDYNPTLFQNKVIFCPCDDPDWSKFTEYFSENFDNFGLKELISTCYSKDGKGRIFRKTSQNTEVLFLDGDGDFRSQEITALRDKADFIITNPPFSLFRDFMAWVTQGDKKFSAICNKNCVTFKEIFPKIQANEIWSGFRAWAGGMWFETIDKNDVDKIENGITLKNISSIWLTNIEHGRRYEQLNLLTMTENKQSQADNINLYQPYDNYIAIEVSKTKAIPSDFEGVMGVPISFLDKYNPEQFKIIGMDSDVKNGKLTSLLAPNWHGKLDRGYLNGKRMYSRLLIQLR